MLENSKAHSIFAVDDVPTARAFYGGTLGLRVSGDGPNLRLHLAGGGDTLVYPKPDFTPATYTILNFPVEDIESAETSWRSAACGSSGTPASTRTSVASCGWTAAR